MNTPHNSSTVTSSGKLNHSWRNHLIRLGLTLIGTVLILGILITKIDTKTTFQLLGRIDRFFLIPMLVVSLLGNILLASDKFIRILANIDRKVSMSTALFIRMGAAPIKFIFPAKAGEMIKGVYLQRRLGIPFSEVVSTLLFDKITNLLSVFLLVLPGLLLSSLALWIKIICVAGIAVVIYLFAYRTSDLIAYLTRFTIPWRVTVLRLLRCFNEIGRNQKLGFLLYSLVFICTEVVSSYCALKAVGITIPLSTLFFKLPIIMVLGNLPFTISGLGTREAAFVLLFKSLGTSEALFAAGLLVSLVEYMLVPVLGLPFLPVFMVKTFQRTEVNETVP